MLKTRLSLASCLLAVTLAMASTPATADPLSPSQLDRMQEHVRSQLDGNVVGYQFAVAQDGELLRTYSHGMANLRKGKSMRSSYRLNVGSVSKLVTAVTVLKLAEMERLDLDEPFTKYLDETEFTNLDPTIEQITIRELLTYTARLPSSNCLTGCPATLQNPRKLDKCRVTLDVGESRFPYRCSYEYQNADFHLLRFVIQGVEPGVDTTEEVVALTRELWLDEAGLDMGCDPHPTADMRYYTTCDLANYADDNCLDEDREGACECIDGTFFEFRAPAQSEYCSSGGWRASASDLARLLALLRDGPILGPEMTDFLLDKTIEDGYKNPGSAAVSWNRPWSSAEGPNLGKMGGLHLLTAYATLLPDAVSAALLINTKDSAGPPTPGVETNAWDVLQEAWENRDP